MAFGSSFDLSSLDGSNGFSLNGVGYISYSGRSVSAAGDINGDGIGDLVIGADHDAPNGTSSGASYVVFGRSDGFTTPINLSTLDGSDGFVLNGASQYDYSGHSVSAAGDVNDDGIDDLIIGAPFASPNGFASGSAFVVFGSSDPFSAEIELSSLDGTNGFILNGEEGNDNAGYSVSTAGDINGDGIDDVVVGAFNGGPSGAGQVGKSYIVFGSSDPFNAEIELSSLDGSNGFVLNGVTTSDGSGFSVSAAGDVNGDSIDDLVIGSYSADASGVDGGEAYVVFGSSDGFGAAVELSTLDGTNGFTLLAAAAGGQLGRSVSGAGDVNGDGIADVIVGAPKFTGIGGESGRSYVVFGRTDGFTADIDLATLDGSNGFAIDGISAGDRSGYSVSAAGDVNGDGVDDVIVGAKLADTTVVDTGAAYVVYGRTDGFGSVVELSTLDGTNGFVLNGLAGQDLAGGSVSDAGDLNDDGIPDFVIGAEGADPSFNDRSGTSYVVFGQSAPPPPPPPPPPGPPPPPPPPPSNHSPVAGDDAFSVQRSGKLTVAGPGLLGNDGDEDGDRLTITGLASGPEHGTLAWSADGGFVYTPYTGFVGSDSFVYLVGDGKGGSDTGDVAITVFPRNPVDFPVTGGFGSEFLSGSYKVDTISGMGGDDTIEGDGGRDLLNGNDGDDTVRGEGDEDVAWGGQGNDLVDGGAGDDWALGDRGDDTVRGGFGNDWVWGGQGNDQLFGDAGNDVLHGDFGNDTLTGGDGPDQFVFGDGGGLDEIADYDLFGGDVIRLAVGADGLIGGVAIGSFADILAHLEDRPDGVFLSLGDGNGITIAGITKGQLSADDFVIV